MDNSLKTASASGIATGGESRRLQVADLVIDLGRLSVTRDGVPLAVPGLSFDLLVALARTAPDVMTIDALLDRVWRGVVVSPETVSQRVKLLRDALGDDPREPRYIAGVRGRGYRLIPAVLPLTAVVEPPPPGTASAGSAAPPPAESAPEPAPPAVPEPAALASPATATAPAPSPPAAVRRSHRPIIVGAAALAALALAGVTAWRAGWLEAVRAPAASPSAGAVDVVGLPPRTVAVLPFQNLSADPANAFIGLGVAEIVLNRLAGSEALVVIARSSSFAFEGRNVDAREIGRQLGARYLVQGGVQRAGDRLRVTSQLVDAQTGRQLRALTFDRAVADLFDVQDEIAAQMAVALDAPGVARPRDTNVIDAHLAYLQGLEAAARYRVAEFEAAIGHFARARSLDPRYAAAYAAEALARIRLARLRNAGEPVVGAADHATIESLVARSLELDPNSSAAYVARGILEGRDAADAERDLRRAIALEPSNGEAYFELAQRLGPLPQRAARQAELLELLERAILLDPLQPRPRYVYALERQGEGMEALERNLLEVLRVDPDYVQALNRLGQLQAVYRGELARGLELIERSIAADPRNDYPRRVAASVYLDFGDVPAAMDVAAPLQDNETLRVEAALRLGDVEEAGRRTRALLDSAPARRPWAALANSSGNYGPYPFVTAIVEHGLRAGETGRALRLLREYDSPQNPLGGLGAIARTGFELGIARLERAAGDAGSADRRAQEVLRLMDSGTVPAQLPRARAVYRSLALAFLRRDDEAIRVLGEAQRAAPIFAWWIALERDSTFDALRGDPRFQAIVAEARRHAAQQRALVEEMRRSGRLPPRPSAPRAP